MDIEEIINYCMSKPDVEQDFPFGPETMVFKIKGKIFLLLPLDSDILQFNVKCEPDRAIDLRERYSCIVAGYHMNKKHWNTVTLDGSIDNQLVREMIDQSYYLVGQPIKNKKL